MGAHRVATNRMKRSGPRDDGTISPNRHTVERTMLQRCPRVENESTGAAAASQTGERWIDQAGSREHRSRRAPSGKCTLSRKEEQGMGVGLGLEGRRCSDHAQGYPAEAISNDDDSKCRR